MRQYSQSLETHLSIPVGGILLNRAALENPGSPTPTEAFRSGPSFSVPGVGDCVTKELLLNIEAQLPNIAASSFGLRALRARLAEQISEAKELRSSFPDSFLHGRVSPVLSQPWRANTNHSEIMKSKCPECGFKLGDFLYAAACPNCHQVLKQNQAKPAPPKKAPGPRSWPVRLFLTAVHFIES